MNSIRFSLFLFGLVASLHGQTSRPGTTAGATNSLTYLSPTLLPSAVRTYLHALGDRLTKPGNERVTLNGTFTTSNQTGPARLVWEVPGQIRFDGPASLILVYAAASGLLNGPSLSQTHADILESLFDDAPEQFLYGFMRGGAMRYQGGGFRTDDSKTSNYQGPLYDVYNGVVSVKAQTGDQRRTKTWLIDSRTGLVAKAEYMVGSGSGAIAVVTEFNKWSSSGNDAQAFPGQVVRRENGKVVFTFDITAGSFGPSVSDGLFSNP